MNIMYKTIFYQTLMKKNEENRIYHIKNASSIIQKKNLSFSKKKNT